MPNIIQWGDVTGSVINGWTSDAVNCHNGYLLREVVGYAKITNALQTNIPIFIPSGAQTATEQVSRPDRRLILPAGAIVTRIGLRLPKVTNTDITQYGELAKKATLIGTTGEFVKVGADGVFTATAPSIASVANAYPLNGTASAQRIAGQADVALSGLVTIGAATPMSVLVSNAANAAAGTGIRASAGVGLAIVQICYLEIKPVTCYEEMGYQSIQKGN